MAGNHAEVQRLHFYSLVLMGFRGITYGANGIWQFNTESKPFGPAPYGAALGNTPWRKAYQFEGSKHVGIAKRFFERFPWWRLESHPEWVTVHADDENPHGPYAAGIPGELKILYFPKGLAPWAASRPEIHCEPQVTYRATFCNPTNGESTVIDEPAAGDSWRVPMPTVMHDWLLVLEKEN